jgi:hypothetical protein
VKDFRFVQAKTLLKVTSYAPIRGFSPPSLVLVGEKLDRAEKIFYNGVQAKNFAVSSASRLIVQIPESEVGRQLKSLQVTSSVPGLSADAQLSFSVDTVGSVEGMDRLVQGFLIILLSTPGSDAFEPSSGGGVRSLVGRATSGTGKGVAADLAVGVEKAKSELLSLQSQDRRIPPDERLLSAALVNVDFDSTSTMLSAIIEVTNSMGQSAQVTVSG